MAPTQLHVPVGNPLTSQLPVMHSVSPGTVTVATAPAHATQVAPPLNTQFFAGSAAPGPAVPPAAYFSTPTFPTDQLLASQAAAASAVPSFKSPEAQALAAASLPAHVAAGHVGSMAPLAQQLQAVAIVGPAGYKAKPFLGMDTGENAR